MFQSTLHLIQWNECIGIGPWRLVCHKETANSAEKTSLDSLIWCPLHKTNMSYFKTTGQDTHTVKIQHGKMEQ